MNNTIKYYDGSIEPSKATALSLDPLRQGLYFEERKWLRQGGKRRRDYTQLGGLAMTVKTVKDINSVFRPSVDHSIATDWFTVGCLKWCLMYSRIYCKGYNFTHKAHNLYQ